VCVCVDKIPFSLKQNFSDPEIADFEFFFKKFQSPTHW
jgi:hypothetical protein